jgi:phosphatidylglycerol---prolipoprotein diacylglyceryl transferase
MYAVWFPNMGIKIEDLPRTAITIFGINVYWYGVIINMAILAGFFYALHEAKRTNQPKEIYMDFILYGIIASIVGARLYYVIFSWGYFRNNLGHIFRLRQGGIAIYGAIIGGGIATIVYAKVKKINFWLFADTLATSMILGQAIGRWGNFFNREAFGSYTNSFFAMRYLKDEVRNIPTQVLDNIVIVNDISYIQVHPTFLYESVLNICIFIFLNLYKKHKKFDGELLLIYMFSYGFGRFWIEGLRTDQLIIGNTGVAVSQLVSILFVVSSLVIYIVKINELKKMQTTK